MKTTSLSFCTLLLCFFLCSEAAIAQSGKARKFYREAERAFVERDFLQAIEWCEKALQQSPEYLDARFLLGKCEYHLQRPAGALQHLLSLVEVNGVSSEVYYWLGLACKMQGDYPKAVGYFDTYLAASIGRSAQTLKARIEREGAMLALDAKAPEKNHFEFTNMGGQINSPKDEHAVAFGESASRLIVSLSEKAGSQHGENLKYLYAQGWLEANENDEFEFLNTSQQEGAGVMDGEGEIYYFTRCYGDRCRIYASYKVDGIWLKATALGDAVNAPESSAKAPALSVAGDTLFFASDRRGGVGGYDIWFVVKDESGLWSGAVNLGEPINTPFEETTPFYGSDGSFFFASDGHPGFGGMDIFYVKGLNGNRQVVNAGLPFNSSYNDQSLIANDEQGFMTSDRPDGQGGYDVYTFVNNRKEEPNNTAVLMDSEHHSLYASLFAAKLYGLAPKFLPADHGIYSALGKAEKKQVNKTIDEQIAAIPEADMERIKQEDKILLAALSKEERFFVDRMAAAYFENTGSDILNLSAEDISWFHQHPLETQRKFYRLMTSNVFEIQQEFIAMNTPLIKDEVSQKAEPGKLSETPSPVFAPKSSLSLVKDYEGEAYASAREVSTEEELIEEPELTTMESPEPMTAVTAGKPLRAYEAQPVKRTAEKPAPAESREDIWSHNRGSALQFFQSLPFADRKRVERIIAIKLVNEKYVLNPGLSSNDRQVYQKLPVTERAVVDRLQRYFRSWDFDTESAALRDSDLEYLRGLDVEKRQAIGRIVVQRSVGLDEDALVRFNGPDWERYKRFSDEEMEKIKDVALMLKDHQKFFDVALAYAGGSYAFDDNLALRNMSAGEQMPVASTDPEIPIGNVGHTYESIYFDPGEASLRGEAVVALSELVELYRKNPGIGIGLSAFSGDGSSAADSRQLSAMRVKAARDYVVGKGIPEYRIKTEAHVTSQSALDAQSLESLKGRKLELSIFDAPHVFESPATTYLVQPGNTLYSLSKANGISVDQLMAMNGLNDFTIKAYQPLRVRKEATLDPDFMVAPSTDLLYVDAGEQTTEPEEQDEVEVASDETRPGDRGDEILTIKVNEAPADTRVFHVVKKGERLKTICEQYGVPAADVMRMNRMKNKRVKPGERLLIRQ